MLEIYELKGIRLNTHYLSMGPNNLCTWFLGSVPVGVMSSRNYYSPLWLILVDGELGGLISHQHGLWQGDPLSSMLFILVMDVFNLLVLKASELGLLKPFLWRGKVLGVFFSAEYPQDIKTFRKVPQEVRPLSAEGSQDEGLGKDQQCKTPKLPIASAQIKQRMKRLDRPC
jgi:hypothetical protein